MFTTKQQVINQISQGDEDQEIDNFNIIASAINLASFRQAPQDLIAEALFEVLDKR